MKNLLRIFILIFLTLLASNIYSYEKIHSTSYAQVETPIAINPTNPDNLIGATITIQGAQKWVGIFYTFNAGASWTAVDILTEQGAADPCIAFDPDGVAYLIYQIRANNKIYLKKSYDGGINWPETHEAITTSDLDRPWFAISPIRTGETFNIYISCTTDANEEGNIALYESTDGGHSFSQEEFVNGSETNHLTGSTVGIGPDGKIFLAWAEYQNPNGSIDRIKVREYNSNYTQVQENTYDVFQIGESYEVGFWVKSNSVKADCYPRMAVDTSPFSELKGNVYIVFASKHNAVSSYPSNIYLIKGTNNGGNYTWSGRINVDYSSKLAWSPEVSVRPDGVITVLYYISDDISKSTPIHVKEKSAVSQNLTWQPSHYLNGEGFLIQQGHERTFLGDYFGIATWFGKIYGLWSENENYTNPPYANQQVYWHCRSVPPQTVPTGYSKVLVDQVDESGVSFDKFDFWNQNKFTGYTAPYEWFILEQGTDQIFRAKQDYKSYTTQKYHEWAKDNVYEGVKNHKVISIPSNASATIKANFKTANNVTLKTELMSAGGLDDKVRLRFRDPWYFESGDPNSPYYDPPYGYQNLGMVEARFKIHDSPFNPNTNPSGSGSEYKGVFLNQEIAPNKPYYSVCVPQDTIISFHNDDITWIFQNWTGTNVSFQYSDQNQTAVVFQQSGAVAKAKYKGHFASNSLTALSHNGARKLISPGHITATYCMVYEDNGDIYITDYEPMFGEWVDEELVSDGTGNSAYPCIAVAHNGSEFCVVWQKHNPSTNKYEIIYRSSEDWANPVTITANSTSAISRPVVGVMGWNGWYGIDYYWMFAWDNGDGLKYYDTEYCEIINFPETNESCHNVTITTDPDGSHYKNGIAWQNEGHIYFIAINYNETPEYIIPENITSGYSYFFNSQTPSIAMDSDPNGEIIIAWMAETNLEVEPPPPIESISGNTPVPGEAVLTKKDIYCRKVNIFTGTWDPPTQILFQDYHAITPVVGSVVDDFVLLWKAKDHDFLARLDHLYGSGWGSDIETYPGEGISSPSISTCSWDISAVWSLYDVAPLRIHHEELEEPSENREVKSDSTTRYDYRTASLDLSHINPAWSGSVTLVMSHLVNRTQHTLIPFAPDSLYPGKFLASDHFRTQQNREEVKLKIWVYADELKFGQPGETDGLSFFKINLHQFGPEKENTSDPIVLYETDFPINVTEGEYIKIFEKEISVNLVNLVGKELEIEAELFPGNLLNQQPAYTKILKFEKKQGLEPTENTELVTNNVLLSTIKDFKLYSAFPNPFNPSTTISFDLPKDCQVSLNIFDITGRHIRTLTSSRYPAGSHQIQWDGRDNSERAVASGIYIYRIDAGKFVQSRKMMLLK